MVLALFGALGWQHSRGDSTPGREEAGRFRRLTRTVRGPAGDGER